MSHRALFATLGHARVRLSDLDTMQRQEYCLSMSRLARILAFVFLTAFAAGSAAHAAAATDMSLKMSMAAMDDGGMADCQDCPGNDAQTSACDQFCVTTLVAIFTPAGTDLPDIADVVAIRTLGAPGGYAGPPDPYPPRSII